LCLTHKSGQFHNQVQPYIFLVLKAISTIFHVDIKILSCIFRHNHATALKGFANQHCFYWQLKTWSHF